MGIVCAARIDVRGRSETTAMPEQFVVSLEAGAA